MMKRKVASILLAVMLVLSFGFVMAVPVAAAPGPITAIAINGTPQVGITLTATGLTPSDATVNYQWEESTGTSYTGISGATSSTYILKGSDYNNNIVVSVTGTGSFSGSAISPSVGPVTASPVTNAAITGAAVQVGVVLTAGLTPSGATATYQWLESAAGSSYTAITGETSSTYTPTGTYVGYYIEVTATGTGGYTSTTVTSQAVGPVLGAALTAAAITITPTAQAQVGNVFNATLTPTGATATYVWQESATGSSYTAIALATGSTYTAAAGDAGQYIRLVATGTSGFSGSATSPAVGPITTPITSAGITGLTGVGNVLTATLVPSGATATYVWLESATGSSYTAITPAATSSTYTTVTGDIGMLIKVTATGTGSYSDTKTSAAFGPITTPLTAVAITGVVQVGGTLTATGLTPVGATVNYQWWESATAGGTYSAIGSATSVTYTEVAGDVGMFIKVVATGTGGYSGTVTSAPTLAVTPETINIAAIGGVTPPKTGSHPKGHIVETDQYTGTVTWSPSPINFSLADPEYNSSKFAGATVYTATITLTPKTGYTLTGVPANFFTVAGATTVTNAAGSGVITAVFPTTFDTFITLNANTWTLISVDNYILNSGIAGSTSSAFTGPYSLIYQYTNGAWASATIANLTPVTALYVETTGYGAKLGINYSGAVPVASTVNLIAGWNLISCATWDAANNILSPLHYVTIGTTQAFGLATLVSQGNYNFDYAGFETDEVIPTTSDYWGNSNFYIDASNWSNLSEIRLNPFHGYWVYMNAPTNFGVIPNMPAPLSRP
jgi:hypothetical protein